MHYWEEVHKGVGNGTYRMNVIGGWLVKTETYDVNDALAMTFVPDPNHEWKLEDD